MRVRCENRPALQALRRWALWDPDCPKKPKPTAGSKPKEKGAANVAAAHTEQTNALVAGTNSLAASSAQRSILGVMLGSVDEDALDDDPDPDYDFDGAYNPQTNALMGSAAVAVAADPDPDDPSLTSLASLVREEGRAGAQQVEDR